MSYLFFPEIILHPVDETVTVGELAKFTCETDGGTNGWIVNETPTQDISQTIYGDISVTLFNTPEGTTVVTLAILARPEYNGFSFQCVVLASNVGSTKSTVAILTIQGALEFFNGRV